MGGQRLVALVVVGVGSAAVMATAAASAAAVDGQAALGEEAVSRHVAVAMAILAETGRRVVKHSNVRRLISPRPDPSSRGTT